MPCKTFRLTSTEMIHTPGIFAAMQAEYKSNKRYAEKCILAGWGEVVPHGILKGIVSGNTPKVKPEDIRDDTEGNVYAIDGDTLVIRAMVWTAEAVKAMLPSIPVQAGKKTVYGRVTGRKNQFATVTVDNNKPRAGMPNWYDAPFAWETLANVLNSGGTVSFS